MHFSCFILYQSRRSLRILSIAMTAKQLFIILALLYNNYNFVECLIHIYLHALTRKRRCAWRFYFKRIVLTCVGADRVPGFFEIFDVFEL